MSAEFVLQLGGKPPATAHGNSNVSSAVLIANALWFIRLRWLVIASFVLGAVVGWAGEAELARLGVVVPAGAFLALAGVLAAANLTDILQARRATRDGELAARSASRSLIVQMALDLVVLAVTVHLLGSVETLGCLVYLFHIVLACIFFGPGVSLAIASAGSLSYAAVVLLERAGVLASRSVFPETVAHRTALFSEPLLLGVWLASFVAISLTMWYLVSTLARRVRARDAQLDLANRELVRMAEDRERHMLHVTHELKAPFAAIQANTQLLSKGYCGALTQEALDVVEKIDVRCQRLAGQIKEMLQLSNLRAGPVAHGRRVAVDLAELCDKVITSLRAQAAARSVTVSASLKPARTRGVPDHLHMVVANILSNAIAYSREGGEVEMTCSTNADGSALLKVTDHGIGIPAESLPKIFDEYFRCNVAVQHNRLSTGLGLAIVKHVVEEHGVTVRVASEPGTGTTFTLTFSGTAL